MTKYELYIKNFKNHFGYRANYFPNVSYREAAEALDDELKLKMPSDTAAIEREVDAVMLLVLSNDVEAQKVGMRLGNLMMKDNQDDYVLLCAMEDAANKLEELS